jgi:hypothetical protein
MAVTIRQIGIAVTAAVVLGSAFWLPASANAAERGFRLGSSQWDPGGGDFTWRYGGLGPGWYEQCGWERRTYVTRRGHHMKRWVHVCG